MKKLLRMFAIVSAFISCSALADSQIPYLHFDNVFSFGDSLSDMGNGSDAPVTTPGGGTWNFYLAQKLGFNLAPSNNGGNDFALAGSVTGQLPFDPTPFGFPAETILDQVNGFVNSNNGHINSHALYTVWGGANDIEAGLDYAATQSSNPSFNPTSFGLSLVGASAGNILNAVSTLHNAGAKYIVVPNLPNLGNTPALSENNFLYGLFYPTVYQGLYEFAINTLGLTIPQANAFALANAPAVTNAEVAANGSALTQSSTELAENFNHQQLSNLNHAGFNIIQVDIFGLLNALQQNYRKFGFSASNSTYESVVIAGNGVPSLQPNGSDPSKDIFFDGYHPSATTAAIGADYVISVIEGPLFAGNLAVTPLSVVDGQNNLIQQQLLPTQSCVSSMPAGQFSVFGGGLYNNGNVDTQHGQPGFDSDNAAFTVGTAYRFNQNFLAGAAIGRSMGDVDYEHDAGGFDLDENLVTLFGGYQWANFYTNAELNYGNIDYSNVERNFMLGSVKDTVTGDTTGDDLAAGGILGYNFSTPNNKLKTGPIATLDYQYVHVNPYAETSADFSAQNNPFDALQYKSQNNNSFIGGLGWQLSYLGQINNTQVLPFIQATYNHQFIDQDRMVDAGVVTLPGSVFGMPFTYPDHNYGNINVGIQGVFNSGLAMTLSGNAIVGEPDLDSESVMLSASMPV